MEIVDGITCPHCIRQPESIDICNIVNTPCLLEEGLECDEWNEIREEWKQEDNENWLAEKSREAQEYQVEQGK